MDFKKALDEFKAKLPAGWEDAETVRVNLTPDVINGLLSKGEKPTPKAEKLDELPIY